MGWLSNYWKNKEGSFAIHFAVGSAMLLAGVGAAIDYNKATKQYKKLQDALDISVLSAALADVETNPERSTIGQMHYDSNTQNPCNNTVDFLYGTETITAISDCQVQTWFMGIFGKTEMNLVAKAVATVGSSDSSACLMLLESSDKEALFLNGGSDIVAPGCPIQVNSTNSEALIANGDSDITADKICVNGGYDANGSSNLTPEPTDCGTAADPLASLPISLLRRAIPARIMTIKLQVTALSLPVYMSSEMGNLPSIATPA